MEIPMNWQAPIYQDPRAYKTINRYLNSEFTAPSAQEIMGKVNHAVSSLYNKKEQTWKVKFTILKYKIVLWLLRRITI